MTERFNNKTPEPITSTFHTEEQGMSLVKVDHLEVNPGRTRAEHVIIKFCHNTTDLSPSFRLFTTHLARSKRRRVAGLCICQRSFDLGHEELRRTQATSKVEMFDFCYYELTVSYVATIVYLKTAIIAHFTTAMFDLGNKEMNMSWIAMPGCNAGLQCRIAMLGCNA